MTRSEDSLAYTSIPDNFSASVTPAQVQEVEDVSSTKAGEDGSLGSTEQIYATQARLDMLPAETLMSIVSLISRVDVLSECLGISFEGSFRN